jgi:TatD DNase family protein
MPRTEQVHFLPRTADSHTHLELYEKWNADAGATLQAAAAADGARIVDVGIRPSDYARRTAAFDAPYVSFTSGLHPTSVDQDWRAELDLLAAQLDQGLPIAAIGELGLDFYHSTEFRAEQHEALRAQIELARQHGLAIIVHNRESESEMLEVLRSEQPAGVMHCFSQDADYCRACLDVGMYISFAGNFTYRNADEIREAARLVPDDRLLVETDAPFLSPQAVRGLPNHTGHLFLTITALAELRDTTPEAIAALTHENTARLFRLRSLTE